MIKPTPIPIDSGYVQLTDAEAKAILSLLQPLLQDRNPGDLLEFFRVIAKFSPGQAEAASKAIDTAIAKLLRGRS